jgi:prepilin-type N-terminal cleavage/methylation domain-containing protein
MAKLGLDRGFTLIEIIIVLALMATLYAVAMPQFGVITGTTVANNLGRLSGDIRNAFDRAVLTGKIHRMGFNLVSGEYYLEETESPRIYTSSEKQGRDPTEEESESQQEEFKEKMKAYKDLAGDEISTPDGDEKIQPTSPIVEASERIAPPEWRKVDSTEWGPRSIGPELIFMDIQAEHHASKQAAEELGEKGRAFIYFFPAGYVERSVIHIGYRKNEREVDETLSPYTLKTSPMVGIAAVESGYVELDVNETSDEE